jgi:hypothetical protein
MRELLGLIALIVIGFGAMGVLALLDTLLKRRDR